MSEQPGRVGSVLSATIIICGWTLMSGAIVVMGLTACGFPVG